MLVCLRADRLAAEEQGHPALPAARSSQIGVPRGRWPMASNGGGRKEASKASSGSNWLEVLEQRVRELPARSKWSEDSELAHQCCRRLIMTRFPELPRPFPDQVLRDELSRGETLIRTSDHAERINQDLKPEQRSQLAGLLLDVREALKFYNRHTLSSKSLSKLAAERNRRERMLIRKVSNIRRELGRLLEYAKGLHPLLGLDYVHAAKRCLKSLSNLKEYPPGDEFYHSFESAYPMLEDPRQLGIVELYCFFRYEVKCSSPDSEVRTAMLANEFLASTLKYIPKYRDAESQGCPAVRIAVSRFRQRTRN
jgi:hypothetical protein